MFTNMDNKVLLKSFLVCLSHKAPHLPPAAVHGAARPALPRRYF